MQKTKSDYKFRELIGKKLRVLRDKKGISQRDLSEICNVSQTNIANIENGKYSVGLDVLHRMSSALGANVEIIEKKVKSEK